MFARGLRRVGPLAPLLAVVLAGCSGVHSSRLEACRNRSQALQVETARLKDEALRLRSQNRELARRAVEDAARLQTLEESQAQLQQSVVAYQKERDELAAAFARLQGALRAAAADSPPRASLDRFETFARAQPGCRLDARRGVWIFPADALFRPASTEWTPGADLLLSALARLMDDPAGPIEPGSVACRAGSPEIVQASAGDAKAPDGLPGRRAQRVRDRLAGLLQVDADAIAAVEAPGVGAETIEILLVPRPAGDRSHEPAGGSRDRAGS
jgi:hypothetical protein